MTMNNFAPHQIEFRPLKESDFPTLAAWLVQPHVGKFYQKSPITQEDVALEYGPLVRGEESTICHLAFSGAVPFAYLQCYRNADYPAWADIIGVNDGIRVDLFVGEPTFLHRGFGRAALAEYLLRIAFPWFAGETWAYIAHELTNTAAVQCSRAVGFRPLRTLLEEGVELMLFRRSRIEGL
jgi:aminoglycoside 6'-N-acetyltransferase